MLSEWRALRTFSLLMALGLSGCASWFADNTLDPQVHLLKVEVVRARLLEQRFMLYFRVNNPNDSDLTVRGLVYRIHLSEFLLAEGESSKWFTVDPKSSGYFQVPIRTNLWQHLREVVKLLKKPDQPIPYYLEGTLETGIFIGNDVHLAHYGEIIPGDLIPE
ncbi:LEA type 2 family protein [Pseudomonas sp. 6D_7.1_Bac1]|uniref:LEA type 2 family protein n=1 Tax=Pseudomonas sp. 6D_7.1_Bac1 TaxID=2971615 RepID=UPI0021C9773D|nr:LEA type 2 family protein [Pseudomonas sp. 6D_7.1_Bac1]MCU1750478.1 LEA type 2 family protein [Pseudomonas sp. 6D_7.1_Bac1]